MITRIKKIFGLIGYPVSHSLSPAMHNAAFKYLGINAEYKLFEIKPAELENFLLTNIKIKDTKGKYFSSQDILGFNITIPHKVRASEILLGKNGVRFIKDLHTEQDHYVFMSGAINTIKRENKKIYYYNTDAEGFMKSLIMDLKFDTEGKNILVLGCGGAGRAVVAGLTWKKIKKIFLYDTSQDAVKAVKEQFDRFDFTKNMLEYVLSKEELPGLIKDCQLLINASPIGMNEGDASVIDKNLLHRNLFIYDLVYNKETQLIKDARSLEIPTKGGLGMLLYQGALSFEIWTGKKAPIEVMRQALDEAIKKL